MPKRQQNRPTLTRTLLYFLFLFAGSFIPTQALRLFEFEEKKPRADFPVFTAVGRSLVDACGPLLVASTDYANNWVVPSVSDAPLTGEYDSSSCTGSGLSSVCSTVGLDYTDTVSALLAVKPYGSSNWSRIFLPDLGYNVYLRSTSCTGSGATSICMAAGQSYLGDQPAVLADSTAGGYNWAPQNITNMPKNGVFITTSCTGSGSFAVCLAGGKDWISSAPLLVESTNGSKNYTRASLDSLPENGVIMASECIGNSPSAACIILGRDDDTGFSFLAVKTYGNNSNWAAIPGLARGYLYAVSCTDELFSFCSAVGQDDNHAPLLLTSTDDLHNWVREAVTDMPTTGVFMGTSCTGSGLSAICAAGGTTNPNIAASLSVRLNINSLNISFPPIIAATINRGKKWAMQSIADLPTNGWFGGVTCTGSESSAVCMAAGVDNGDGSSFDDQKPLLTVSTNGTRTWNSVQSTIPNLPVNGSFYTSDTLGGHANSRKNINRNSLFAFRKKASNDSVENENAAKKAFR